MVVGGRHGKWGDMASKLVDNAPMSVLQFGLTWTGPSLTQVDSNAVKKLDRTQLLN